MRSRLDQCGALPDRGDGDADREPSLGSYRRAALACGGGGDVVGHGFALSAYLGTAYLRAGVARARIRGHQVHARPFWALVTAFLSGSAAAGGIALINSVGNLGGFFGPYIVGVIKDRTHSDLVALLFLGSALFCMGVLALTVRPVKARKE